MDLEDFIILFIVSIFICFIVFCIAAADDVSDYRTNECKMLIYDNEKFEDGQLYVAYNNDEQLYLLTLSSKEKEFSIVIPKGHIDYILEGLKEKDISLSYEDSHLLMKYAKQEDNKELVELFFEYQKTTLAGLIRYDILLNMFKELDKPLSE